MITDEQAWNFLKTYCKARSPEAICAFSLDEVNATITEIEAYEQNKWTLGEPPKDDNEYLVVASYGSMLAPTFERIVAHYIQPNRGWWSTGKRATPVEHIKMWCNITPPKE